MSNEIREAARKFVHSCVYMYSTMFAKQFPFSKAVHENVLIRLIYDIKASNEFNRPY